MPSASATTAASVNPGVRASSRAPKRTSCAASSIQRPTRACRTSSLTCSAPVSAAARRRASSGGRPAAAFSSARRATYDWTSSSRSRSTRSRAKSRRPKLRIPDQVIASLRSGLEGQRHGHRDPPPLLGLGLELLPAGPAQPVVLRAPPVLGLAPGRLQPACLLHAVQRREERPRLHLEGAAGDLLEPARDAEPVHLAERERLQDQQVEGPLEQRGRGRHPPPIERRYERVAPLVSNVNRREGKGAGYRLRTWPPSISRRSAGAWRTSAPRWATARAAPPNACARSAGTGGSASTAWRG